MYVAALLDIYGSIAIKLPRAWFLAIETIYIASLRKTSNKVTDYTAGTTRSDLAVESLRAQSANGSEYSRETKDQELPLSVYPLPPT